MGEAAPAVALLRLALPLSLVAALAPEARADTNWSMRVRTVGDYLLSQQTPHGCIPDVPGGSRANQDSAMQYALVALAHACRVTTRDRFRRGLRSGIEWLAAGMEKRQKPWVGSWRHAYSTRPPYLALPTPPHADYDDGRGSTTTSALFAYLVYLYRHCTGDAPFVLKVRPHVRAALDFTLEHNLGNNDLFHNGWLRSRGTARWQRDPMHDATTQAAAYLGLRAGYRLLGHVRYSRAAERLAKTIDESFFDPRRGAFGLARDSRGRLVPPDDSCRAYHVQGYLAWVFGIRRETRDAIRWLKARHAPDGTFRRKRTDTPYVLPAAAFCLGSARLGLYASDRQQARRWLRDYALTPKGAVREAATRNSPTPSHLTGWVVAACLGANAFPTEEPQLVP